MTSEFSTSHTARVSAGAGAGATTGPSRRTVATGLAWSLPAVAVVAASPLAAASGPVACVTDLIDWNQFAVGTAIPDGAVLTASGATGVTAVVNFSGTSTFPTTVKTGDAGIPGNFLELGLDSQGSYTKTVTVTFSEPVSDLSFTIGDVDSWTANSFQESAWLSPETFVATATGSTITGSGTAASPWVGQAGLNVRQSESTGNISVLYAGPIQQFTLTIGDHVTNSTIDTHSADLYSLSFCVPSAE